MKALTCWEHTSKYFVRELKIQLMNKIKGLILLLLIIGYSGCTKVTEPNDDGNSIEYSHRLNPGSSANDFLSDDTFKELVIEIDYMGSHAPNSQALDSLQVFLEQQLHKTKITILEPTQIPSGGQSTYSADDVRRLEANHRSTYTDSTLAAYMIIVDGRFEQNNVLGIAYYNTSNAFFGLAYEDATSGFSAPSRYLTEAISFRHEFGHLFGLVGIAGSGTNMVNDHKDVEHGNHCTNESCLMYYAMESPDLFEVFLGGEQIPKLDEFCLQDLAGNRD